VEDCADNFSRLSTSPLPVTSNATTSPSTPYSRHPSTSFSQKHSDFDSATDVDSEDSESDLSGSDGSVSGGVAIDTVVSALDVHLVLILGSRLDLAARLIPRIYGQFYKEDEASIFGVLKSDPENCPNDGEEEVSKGKERASLIQQSSNSDSSARKHGRSSGNSPGKDMEKSNNSNKRSRRGRGSDKGQVNDGSPNPTDAPDGSADDPDDPDEDPGDDPNLFNNAVDPPDYACHFHKRNPEKYSPYKKKYAKCLSSCITELRRIK
jgi:hypothetical protein